MPRPPTPARRHRGCNHDIPATRRLIKHGRAGHQGRARFADISRRRRRCSCAGGCQSHRRARRLIDPRLPRPSSAAGTASTVSTSCSSQPDSPACAAKAGFCLSKPICRGPALENVALPLCMRGPATPCRRRFARAGRFRHPLGLYSAAIRRVSCRVGSSAGRVRGIDQSTEVCCWQTDRQSRHLATPTRSCRR